MEQIYLPILIPSFALNVILFWMLFAKCREKKRLAKMYNEILLRFKTEYKLLRIEINDLHKQLKQLNEWKS